MAGVIGDSLHASLLWRRRRNGLRLVWRSIRIIQRNGRFVGNRERASDLGAQARVLTAAVTSVEARVDIETHQVGATSQVFAARRLTAGQGSKRIQIDSILAPGNQVGIQKWLVA